MSDLFSHWMITFGKTYASESEQAVHFQIFQDNYMFILNWNADPTATSQVELNQYADLNTEMFSAQIGCLTMTMNEREIIPFNITPEEIEALPATVNWATAGAVTPIKNQGQCGSCWAFSTTGSLEGLHFIADKSLLSFSEQQLVDCSGSYGNQGCNGGLMDNAFKYVIANGIELESVYPYTAVDGTCKYSASSVVFKNTGYTDVTQNNQIAL